MQPAADGPAQLNAQPTKAKTSWGVVLLITALPALLVLGLILGELNKVFVWIAWVAGATFGLVWLLGSVVSSAPPSFKSVASAATARWKLSVWSLVVVSLGSLMGTAIHGGRELQAENARIEAQRLMEVHNNTLETLTELEKKVTTDPVVVYEKAAEALHVFESDLAGATEYAEIKRQSEILMQRTKAPFANATHQKAESALQKGDLVRAKALLETVIKTDAEYPKANDELAQVNEALAAQEARRTLEAAISEAKQAIERTRQLIAAESYLDAERQIQGALESLGRIPATLSNKDVKRLTLIAERLRRRVEGPAKEEWAVRNAESLGSIAGDVFANAVGKNVNWENEPSTLIATDAIEQAAGPDKGGYLVQIRYRANTNLTTSLTKDGIVLKAMEGIRAIYQEPRCEKVAIVMLQPHLVLTDRFGNSKEEQVAKIVLRRFVAKRINWKNMHLHLFEQLLQSDGQIWVHPAIRQ